MENVTNGVRQWKLPPNVGQNDEYRVVHIHPVTGPAGTSALEKQVGGNHYKQFAIQPVEFINANNLSYMQGNVIKYVLRYPLKNGIADLEKAKHYLEMLIEFERNKQLDKK